MPISDNARRSIRLALHSGAVEVIRYLDVLADQIEAAKVAELAEQIATVATALGADDFVATVADDGNLLIDPVPAPEFDADRVGEPEAEVVVEPSPEPTPEVPPEVAPEVVA